MQLLDRVRSYSGIGVLMFSLALGGCAASGPSGVGLDSRKVKLTRDFRDNTCTQTARLGPPSGWPGSWNNFADQLVAVDVGCDYVDWNITGRIGRAVYEFSNDRLINNYLQSAGIVRCKTLEKTTGEAYCFMPY